METNRFFKIEKLISNAFNLFSSLLLEPDAELIREEVIFSNLGSYLNELLPGKGDELANLPAQIKKHSLQELQVEYARLFIGPFKVLAPPYSSLHLGEEIVMGNATVWVQDFYRDAGLEFDRELRDLPDHAAVETEFLYYLIFNELSTLDQGFYDDSLLFWEKQKTFFEKHYKLWIPKLCDKVIQYSEIDYFKIIFQSLKALVLDLEIPDFPPITS